MLPNNSVRLQKLRRLYSTIRTVGFFISGLVAVLLLGLNIAWFKKSGIDSPFFAGIFLTCLLLLYPFYIRRISRPFSLFLNAILLFSAGAIWALAALSFYFVSENYPPGHPFPEKIVAQTITQDQKDGYDHYVLQSKIGATDIRHLAVLKAACQSDSLLPMNKKCTEADSVLSVFLDLMASNQWSVYDYNWDTPVPNYGYLKQALWTEWGIIAALCRHNQTAAVDMRFRRMWDIMQRYFSGHHSLVSYTYNGLENLDNGISYA